MNQMNVFLLLSLLFSFVISWPTCDRDKYGEPDSADCLKILIGSTVIQFGETHRNNDGINYRYGGGQAGRFFGTAGIPQSPVGVSVGQWHSRVTLPQTWRERT